MPLSNQDVESVIGDIEAIVGSANVVFKRPEIDRLRKTTIPYAEKGIAYVYPDNRQQLQSILAIANTHNIKIWTVSQGRNWGYGTSSPVTENSIVLSLKKFNKIIKIDEELAYAIIEPGVTFQDLNNYLKENNIKLWMDCIDGTPFGSVIGNALEKGVGMTPYGDHFGSLCGMEVLLANGDIIETGGGPTGNYKGFHTYKWGVGPYSDGLFCQSNYGIVLSAGLWLMPKPDSVESFVFMLKDNEQFNKVIDIMRYFLLNSIIQAKVHMMNSLVMTSILQKYPYHLLKSDQLKLTDENIKLLESQYGFREWSLSSALYGTKQTVKANKKIIKKLLRPYGRVEFFNDKKINAISKLITYSKGEYLFSKLIKNVMESVSGFDFSLIETVPASHELAKGIPTERFIRHGYFKSPKDIPDGNLNPARDDCGIIWYAPIIPLRGNELKQVIDTNRALFNEFGFDCYAALLAVNPRVCVLLHAIFYSKLDSEEAARAQNLFDQLAKAGEKKGYQQYRTNIHNMKNILRCNAPLLSLLNDIKRAVDPKNILSPGKYNIGNEE